jgi:hypothetical protein
MGPRKSSAAENRVRRSTKTIEYSIGSLEAYLSEHGGTFSTIARVRGSSEFVRVAVRVRRADKPESWAMSILMNNQRVDGIDWELTVHDRRGKDCRGWHRHIWTAAAADTLKECLPDFKPETVRDFLLSGFHILKVQLKKEGRDAENRMLWD